MQKIGALKKKIAATCASSPVGQLDRKRKADVGGAGGLGSAANMQMTKRSRAAEPADEPRELNRAQRKKKVVGINRRLQELARRKQLTKAESCFHCARAKGLADVHKKS